MLTLRSRSVLIDVASAALLILGAVNLSLLPGVARVALAIVFFLGIGRLSLRFARLLLPGEDRATTLTATLVLIVACWTVVATTLGHFGALTPRNLLLAAALALLAAAVRATPVPAPPEQVLQTGAAPERAAILAALAFFVISTVLGVFSQRDAPPGARGYDDTSYHLSAVATWHQWHDLRSIKFPVGDGSTTFYPIAGELFSLLLLVLLGGVDLLARWSEVPFALASLVALTSLARLLSLRAEAAGVAVLLYAASPRVFPLGMLGAGNDHAMGCFILASACGALLLQRGPNPRRAIFLGASLGLVIGTKYTGAMFLPPLLLMAGACAASRLRRMPVGDRRPALRSAGLGCLAGALTMLGVGGYTYLRNAVVPGIPSSRRPSASGAVVSSRGGRGTRSRGSRCWEDPTWSRSVFSGTVSISSGRCFGGSSFPLPSSRRFSLSSHGSARGCGAPGPRMARRSRRERSFCSRCRSSCT